MSYNHNKVDGTLVFDMVAHSLQWDNITGLVVPVVLPLQAMEQM